ncbi:MAG: 2-amino-4-hydroxy-6-hydroxymethyldihydropteridine diphosphokinase [Ignavibacteria bacterium]
MKKVFLSLGSNKGNRFRNILQAIVKISQLTSTRLEKISSVYETEPYKVKDQQKFLNLLLLVSTSLTPVELHQNLLSIEKELGRKTKGDQQAREIDIDILFYGDEVIEKPELKIPHYDLHNRKFVLVPFVEIEPDFVHPVFKKSIKELLSQLKDDLSVTKLI